MGVTYTSGNGAHTPATNQDNWTLDAGASGTNFAKVIAIGWGGRLTTSTGYRTRWTRPTTAGSSTFTALTNAYHSPNFATVVTRVGTFATAPTLAADPAGNLWAQDWNAQGGMGMVVMPLANPWFLLTGILQGQISCRNIAGVDAGASSYEVTVEEG